jgi:transposase
MLKNRRKHSASFKAKVALEAIREQDSVAAIAQRYKIHTNVVYKWKQQLLSNIERTFDKDETIQRDNGEREAELLKKIGELTVERDFLEQGLGRFR